VPSTAADEILGNTVCFSARVLYVKGHYIQ